MGRFTRLVCALCLTVAANAAAAPCPERGGAIALTLEAAAGAATTTAVLSGTLLEASCDDTAGALATTYAVGRFCDPAVPDSCSAAVGTLRPGRWRHHVEVFAGETTGRSQTRTALLLDASAGPQAFTWPAYRSITVVRSLADAIDCEGCLRAALTAANVAAKPTLIQFAPALSGAVVLAAPLPPLSGGDVTLDGYDAAGAPGTRTIDAAGLNNAALRITSARNVVTGMRIANSGGDSDTLLIDGLAANDNLVEDVAVIGRAVEPCTSGDAVGCVLDGVCVVPTATAPRGACGDDAIAVRDFAGALAPNVIRAAEVRGAHDKGIKVSDNAVARVERCTVGGNTDGGIQATLSGQVIAEANVVLFNRGTFTANGIAANGARAGSVVAAQLETRGNLVVQNALRGISVRSLSRAVLQDDYSCGNGTAGRSDGFGLAVFDAAGQAASADVSGLAAVHNVAGGVAVGNSSLATFGTPVSFGRNAFAFNGLPEPPVPLNFQNLTSGPLIAVGNQWEHCGPATPCDIAQVLARDVFRAAPASTVDVDPGLPTAARAAPQITAVDPPFAAAGELVRIYGSGFDAIDGAGSDCGGVVTANTCRPVRGNCVFVDRQPADVIAVTPTMLVIRAPFTCVAPVEIATRSRRSRGFGRATFCTAPPAAS